MSEPSAPLPAQPYDADAYEPIPVERRVPCPEGWEPVVDTACGQPAMYVEINNDPTALLRDVRKVWVDGSPTQDHEFAHCSSCGRGVAPGSYARNAIRRDENGVRRLW